MRQREIILYILKEKKKRFAEPLSRARHWDSTVKKRQMWLLSLRTLIFQPVGLAWTSTQIQKLSGKKSLEGEVHEVSQGHSRVTEEVLWQEDTWVWNWGREWGVLWIWGFSGLDQGEWDHPDWAKGGRNNGRLRMEFLITLNFFQMQWEEKQFKRWRQRKMSEK